VHVKGSRQVSENGSRALQVLLRLLCYWCGSSSSAVVAFGSLAVAIRWMAVVARLQCAAGKKVKQVFYFCRHGLTDGVHGENGWKM
jgi:hypothetical protein